MRSFHFIGIGGVGMSALAQAYLDAGFAVSGSDRLLEQGLTTSTLSRLKAQGVALFPQDGSGISAATTESVIYSTAIEDANLDWCKAKSEGIPCLHRSEALAKLSQGHDLIAVTGTCGKSSVTAMLGHLLSACGLDPFVVNGAEMTGLDCDGRIGSVRASQSATGLMVVEADESDKSLMNLQPTHVIVTNASSDHFSKSEADALFDAFKAKASGVILDTRAVPLAFDVLPATGWESRFHYDGADWMLPMPGLHNIHNATLAIAMAQALGAKQDQLIDALATFRGIRRRLERVGECNGATVIDDYAHNVEKLRAAWTTLTAAFPHGVCGVWRPHGYAPLRKMIDDLAIMFNEVVRPIDTLLLLPVYDAGGTADRSITTEDLSVKLTVPAKLIHTIAEAEVELRATAALGKALVTLGARDPELPILAQRLATPTKVSL